MTTLGPCLQRPRQSTESMRTSPAMSLSRSSPLSTLRTSFEPRFLQSPPLQSRTWASYSLIFAAGLFRGARAPFARYLLAFFAFFLEMVFPSTGSGLRRRNLRIVPDKSQYTILREGVVSLSVQRLTSITREI